MKAKKKKSKPATRSRRKISQALHKVIGTTPPGASQCLYLDGSHNTAGSPKEMDRLFFKSNPKRVLRMRRVALSEIPPEMRTMLSNDPTHVLVRKLAVGLREKRIVPPDVSAEELDSVPDSEPILNALWAVATDPHQRFSVRDVLYPEERGGGAH